MHINQIIPENAQFPSFCYNNFHAYKMEYSSRILYMVRLTQYYFYVHDFQGLFNLETAYYAYYIIEISKGDI